MVYRPNSLLVLIIRGQIKLEFPKTIKKIQPSIVQIRAEASETIRRQIIIPIMKEVLGTGFFVNSEGYVITAKHVWDYGQQLLQRTQADIKQILVGISIENSEQLRGNFSLVGCDLVDQDVRHDIALLKLKKNPFTDEISSFNIGGKKAPLLYGVPRLNAIRPIDGTSIGISGYPLNETVLVTNSGVVASSWSTDSINVPVGTSGFTIPNISDVYLGDIEVNPGDSGAPTCLLEDASIIGLCVASKPAPVRNQNGNIVVINTQQLFFSSGLTIIVPSYYIIKILEKNNVDFIS